MPVATRKSTCVTRGLPYELCCDVCKPLKCPLSNTRTRSATTCLRPWDIDVWGDHKQLVKVKLCHEVRQYLKLNDDNITVEDTYVYPNKRPKLKDVGKTTDSRKK